MTTTRTKKTCNVDGCPKKPTILGLCDGHYMSRRGDHTEKPRSRTGASRRRSEPR